MRYINKNDLFIIARNSGKLMIGIGVLCLIPIIVDLIYLEFIELRFCNLDKNLKRKLILKAKIEDINNFLISDEDDIVNNDTNLNIDN